MNQFFLIKVRLSASNGPKNNTKNNFKFGDILEKITFILKVEFILRFVPDLRDVVQVS